MKQPTIAQQLGCYALWILLAGLAAVAAWYIRVVLLVGVANLIESSWRPTYWNTDTIGQIGRLAFLVIGGVWLFAIMWMEQSLQESLKEGHFLKRLGQLVLGIGVVLGICYGVLVL